jgi:hypothetical protein
MIRHPTPAEWFTDTWEPPDPFDWGLVVRVAGFFAAVLIVADLLL